MEPNILSLLPPIIAIVLALITKEVLLSIVAGVFVGALSLAAWNPGAAIINLLDKTGEILGSENIVIVLIVVFLGGLVGLFIKSGGSKAFGIAMTKRIKTRAGAQLVSWLMGVFIFFDDYFNCLTIGPVMRPIIDNKKVSREKLAYIIDSTSASMCTLTPVSSWVAYALGLVGAAFLSVGITDSPLSVYIASIPFNMYSIFALLLIPLVAYLRLDFGPMAKAERRAMTDEKVGQFVKNDLSIGEEYESMTIAEKGKVIDLVIPVIVLLAAAFFFIFQTGGLFEGATLVETFQEADSVSALFYAIFISIVFCVIFYRLRGTVKVKEGIDAAMTGMKTMVPVVVFMTCAWLLGGICEDLGTAEFIVGLTAGAQIGFLIPAMMFVITAAMTFATGSGWGCMAIMIPIAIPIASGMDSNLPATLAAVLSGVVFGDHCSPICDTTIISSAGAQCNHIDHCKTQIPYALTAASAATVGFVVAGVTDIVVLPLIAGLAVFVALLFILHRITSRKMIKEAEIANPTEG